MTSQSFKLEAQNDDSQGRAGVIETPSGNIPTPVFMPVGTQGTVKSIFPRDLKNSINAQVILGNTYHLRLRPGHKLVEEHGGLGAFMGWDGPILTDSGGFQIFSLAKLREVTELGVKFRSHLDGSELFLGPQEAVEIQNSLRSDIAMCLDECPPADASEQEVRDAVARTSRWGRLCQEAWFDTSAPNEGRLLFGIVQGGRFESLRMRSAKELIDLDFPGYAVGGVSVGESEQEMMRQVEITTTALPEDKPRYVMGVGTPPQLLKMISLGADMFDCVMPTREARHGTAFTAKGKINLRNERFRHDDSPLDQATDCFASQDFSRSYLRHLVMSGEMLGSMLLSLHNLRFFVSLLEQARTHLLQGTYSSWAESWIQCFQAGDRS